MGLADSFFRFSTFSALILLLVPAVGCDANPTEGGKDTAEDVRPWTILVYDQADFVNAIDILEDHNRASIFSEGLLKQVRAGENLGVLVLVDREAGPAHILAITEDHRPDTLEALGEVNMGSEETLADFIAFGKDQFPAERYILSVFGHGAGWAGACADVTDGNDFLTMGEMRDALLQTGGVDLLLLNTPCLMGMTEVMYNLRGVTEFVVASEFRSGWVNEPMGDLSDALHATPEIPTEAVATLFVNSIWAHRMVWENVGWPDSLTSSAIRISGMNGVKDQLHALSVSYLQQPWDFRAKVGALSPVLTTFHPAYVDLYDLADELLEVEGSETRRTVLDALKVAVKDAVVAEVHGPAWEDTHGLAIFLPDGTDLQSLIRYRDPSYGLELVEWSLWDDLLSAAFGAGGAALKGGSSNLDSQSPSEEGSGPGFTGDPTCRDRGKRD